MNVIEENPPARSIAEWRQQLEVKAAKPDPSFFHVRAQLPEQGRTNIVLGATPLMSVVLKTYSSGGENELHAHPYEDHLFVIMQGSAKFYGPNGELKVAQKNDCVLLPRNSYYWFHAVEDDEALVMIRVGVALDPSLDPLERIDIDGKPFDGYSDANKEIPVVLSNDWFE
ncbi:cupin domain-containing protein [Acidocella facilis]|uniref:cupin domain-containing protein n=1 Tax=Acidocella facilis TaxID=525 RepID=UPI001F3308CB|nr:cupin domain-containing protein [Acidocella facilis]